MLRLYEIQRRFAASLFSPDDSAVLEWIEGDAAEAAERLGIHRRTMVSSLVSALALTFPAIQSLVGKPFFEQAARAFIAQEPPLAAMLAQYGQGFPTFLAAYESAAGLPYLPAVAKLEWHVDVAARLPELSETQDTARFSLQKINVILAPSLRVLDLHYPADLIWRAVLDEDDAALGALDPARLSAPVRLAVWRDGDGVAIARLGPAAATFVTHLLSGTDGESALLAAAETDLSPHIIDAIRQDVLEQRFVRLVPTV
jgi:hypothetical protein